MGRTYHSKVTNMYIGIAGKDVVSNTTLACLGNGDVCPRTNSCMLSDPSEESATSRLVADSLSQQDLLRALPSMVFIYYTGSQSTREVVFVTKQERYALSIA